MTFKKFPSINQFHNVNKFASYITDFRHTIAPIIHMRGKIKLHGTNGCIRVSSDGNVTAQKRSTDIDLSAGKDNYGFGRWVEDNKEAWSQLAELDDVYIFGEWAGPGINEGDAIHATPRKMFYIFAIYYRDHYIVSTDALTFWLALQLKTVPDVIILPWATEKLKFDFSSVVSIQSTLDYLNQCVERIGKVDPFVLQHWGIEGEGEGLVIVPIDGESYSDYSFKVKSEKHRVNKTKSAAQLDPEDVRLAKEFADMFATEQRFEQGLMEVNDGDADMKITGPFLKWVGEDIKKESADEVAASDNENLWKHGIKACNHRAVHWLKAKVKFA